MSEPSRLAKPRELAVLLAVVGVIRAAAALAESPQPGLESALHACATITANTARLACYDRLAKRDTGASAAGAPADSGSAARSSPVAAAAPAAPAPAAPAPNAAAIPKAAAAPPPDSFGSYAAEHPPPPPAAPEIQASIVALSTARDGKPTVQLDGGAIWELIDGSDPLLAAGDAVTIKRGVLGSFLLYTPTKRIHRVRRLR